MTSYIFDQETINWLQSRWNETLHWDRKNISMLLKEDLSVAEVEEIFDRNFIFGGRLRSPDERPWKEEHFVLFGQTGIGRLVALFWVKRGLSIRPIWCRTMSYEERKIYRTTKRAESF